MNIRTYMHNLGIIRAFRRDKKIIIYPEKIYLSVPSYCDNNVQAGNLELFRNKDTIKLVEYQRGQVIEVRYPAQITIPKNQTIEE
jgi:hypothetical protein